MPSFDSGDDFFRICGPAEGFWVFILLGDEAIDGSLKIHNGVEHTALQPSLCQLGKETFDGIEPGTGRWREVKGEAGMAVEPLADLGMFVCGVIVEDDVHRLVAGNAGVDGVQKADELLVPMLLHVPADNGAIENVERGEQGGRAVALVIMGHRAEPAFLHRQARLGPIQRLYLALLVKRQHDGVRWRIDIQPDDIVELLGKFGIVRELELPVAMRLQPMRFPDAAHCAGADVPRGGHHGSGPVRRLARRHGQRERHHAINHCRLQRSNTRGPGLIAQQAVDTSCHVALLPPPDTGLRFTGLAHDRRCPRAIGTQQDDRCPPRMLLRRVTIPDYPFKPKPVRRRYVEFDPCAHDTESHGSAAQGTPKMDSSVKRYPLAGSKRRICFKTGKTSRFG